MFLRKHNEALQWFTETKEQRRKQARLAGMCTRCIVRRARMGRAYCQRCTDYAARYAKRRAIREVTGRDSF